MNAAFAGNDSAATKIARALQSVRGCANDDLLELFEGVLSNVARVESLMEEGRTGLTLVLSFFLGHVTNAVYNQNRAHLNFAQFGSYTCETLLDMLADHTDFSMCFPYGLCVVSKRVRENLLICLNNETCENLQTNCASASVVYSAQLDLLSRISKYLSSHCGTAPCGRISFSLNDFAARFSLANNSPVKERASQLLAKYKSSISFFLKGVERSDLSVDWTIQNVEGWVDSLKTEWASESKDGFCMVLMALASLHYAKDATQVATQAQENALNDKIYECGQAAQTAHKAVSQMFNHCVNF